MNSLEYSTIFCWMPGILEYSSLLGYLTLSNAIILKEKLLQIPKLKSKLKKIENYEVMRKSKIIPTKINQLIFKCLDDKKTYTGSDIEIKIIEKRQRYEQKADGLG